MMIGELGALPLAGIGVGYTYFLTIILFTMGCFMSVSIMVGRGFGANDTAVVKQYAVNGLWMGIIFSIPVILILQSCRYIMLFLGQDPQVVLLAQSYLSSMSWGIAAFVSGNRAYI